MDMTTAGSTTQSPYIYALMRAEFQEEIPELTGLEGARVETVTVGAVTALISPVKKKRIRPERRNLSAHMNVLKQLMEICTVVPFKFGTVAASKAELKELLSQNQEEFGEQLKGVEGKVEMSVRVVWDVSNVFEYFVGLHAELRSARDAIGDIQQAVREEMIDLGRLFEHLLTEERDRLYEQVAEVFNRHEVEHIRNPPRNERVVMDLSCLVARDELDDFDRVVGEAASSFDANFTFNVSGSWAPVSFVELNLAV